MGAPARPIDRHARDRVTAALKESGLDAIVAVSPENVRYTAGVEIAAHWTPFGTWRIDGSYSAFHLTPHLDPASKDPAAVTFDGGAPAAQYQVHTSVRLGPKAEVTTGLYHVGPLLKTNVPAYTRADARLEFAATKQLSVVATGRNLLERTHRENADPTNPLTSTLVPRTGSVRLVWRF